MARNVVHAMQADLSHDELARQSFIAQLKLYLGAIGRERVRQVYSDRVLPQIKRTLHRPPESAAEISKEMLEQPEYQIWATMYRTGQEQLWRSVEEPLTKADSALSEKYEHFCAADDKIGSLELAPDFDIPAVVRSIDFHLQPGGYALDRNENDILAGAMYEAGGAVYSRSVGVGSEESKAECIIRYLGEWYPGFSPTEILDMGCSAGASSVPYAHAFPDASVHAIDVGPGMLRFAHARAEAIGAAVHFHQRRAENSGFPEQSFDLIISHNLLHELSSKARLRLMKECFRLLKPKGVCVHQDVPISYAEMGPYEQFERNWDENNNGEPFWSSYANGNFGKMMTTAGFDPQRVVSEEIIQLNNRTRWFVTRASNVA